MSQLDNLDFVHLHIHSEYSLVDGIIRVDELLDRSIGLGYHSVALTDLTNLFGLIEFYRSARSRGIKPIVGSEINVAKDKDSISAPIVLGRDHHDVSGTDSPFRETSNIYDGSSFTADMAIQNVIGDSFRGATWVSIHNGGGVGWGEVINGELD